MFERRAKVTGFATLLTVASVALTSLASAPAYAAGVGSASGQPNHVTQYIFDPNAAPGIASPSAAAAAVYVDERGGLISGPESNSTTSAAPSNTVAGGSNLQQPDFGCTPESLTDRPHPSSTVPGDVSGHAWWRKGSCNNDTAKVFNCLFEYYNDGSFRRKACSDTKELKPAPRGSSRPFVNARTPCDSTISTTWRNRVDVNVDGEIDTGEQPYTNAVVACRQG